MMNDTMILLIAEIVSNEVDVNLIVRRKYLPGSSFFLLAPLPILLILSTRLKVYQWHFMFKLHSTFASSKCTLNETTPMRQGWFYFHKLTENILIWNSIDCNALSFYFACPFDHAISKTTALRVKSDNLDGWQCFGPLSNTHFTTCGPFEKVLKTKFWKVPRWLLWITLPMFMSFTAPSIILSICPKMLHLMFIKCLKLVFRSVCIACQ